MPFQPNRYQFVSVKRDPLVPGDFDCGLHCGFILETWTMSSRFVVYTSQMAPRRDEQEVNSGVDPTEFCFIDHSTRDPDSRWKNVAKARSHSAKYIHRHHRAT